MKQDIFTVHQEKAILDFIIKHNAFENLKYDIFWKSLENLKIVDKPWQNIKRHFKNQMLLKLNSKYFNLTSFSIRNILNQFNLREDEVFNNPRRVHYEQLGESDSQKKVVVFFKKPNTVDKTFMDQIRNNPITLEENSRIIVVNKVEEH